MQSQIFVTQPKAVMRHHRCLAWQAFLQQMASIACFSLIMHQNHTDGYAQSKLSCSGSVCMTAYFSSPPKILTQTSVSNKIINAIERLEIAPVLSNLGVRLFRPQNKSLGLLSFLFSLYYDVSQVFRKIKTGHETGVYMCMSATMK